MADETFHIESIPQLHRILGFEEPQHPLITVLDPTQFSIPPEYIGQRISTGFYSVNLKDACGRMVYGRNHYDFDQGVLMFTGPNQVLTVYEETEVFAGWMLFFHPDLIRHSGLGLNMSQYSFFSYDVHEALHLSQEEENILHDIARRIQYEYSQRIDRHTQGLLLNQVELLLNYSLRFYERQFHTRQAHHVDILTQVETLLEDYYRKKRQLEAGTPSIQYIAEQVNLSPNYLSDLLRKETGRNAKDHINTFVVERAKTLLLATRQNVSEVAFELGFNYPHYFSRVFKQHTGMTPREYRALDLN